MKALKITEANKTAIEAALKAVNGKAIAHTFTTATEIEWIADHYEQKVIDLVGAKNRATGAKVTYQSGKELPNAYDHTRQVTIVTLERSSTGWFLTSVTKTTGYKSAGKGHLYLTAQQDASAHEQLRKAYSVINDSE